MSTVYDLVMEDKLPRFLFNNREYNVFLNLVQWHINTYGCIDLYHLICYYIEVVYNLPSDLIYLFEEYRSDCLDEDFRKKYLVFRNHRLYIDEFTYKIKEYKATFSTDIKQDHDPLGFFRLTSIFEFKIMSEVKHE